MLSDDKFTMKVDLNVLDHLGINLYSNTPAVLTEVIANAWDADAKRVDIKIVADHENQGNDYIEIEDDGIGMSVDDLNEKYLYVGFRRRGTGNNSKTPDGRLVMGRKGLGKLALFSIADEIEVQSAKDGKISGFKISSEEIRQAIKEVKSYHPIPLANTEISIKQGTKIVLRKLKKNDLVKATDMIKKSLARRFSIISTSAFEVFINNEQIKPSDHVGLEKIQFLWKFEGSTVDPEAAISSLKQGTIPSNQDNKYPDIGSVNGWIGTANKPNDLKDKDVGNINGIVILARGRLFHENILTQLSDARLYTKYLTGQMEIDSLDEGEIDIATSDRQRIQENDPRYLQLVDFLRESLNQVERDWSKWRGDLKLKEAKDNLPILQKWLDSLSKVHKESAEKLIKTLASLPVDKEEDIKMLYKHGILAFERMKLHGSHQMLLASLNDMPKLMELLADFDSLEAALYCDIVRTRLDVIKNFIAHIDENSLEKVLQHYIFDHLWLLDPAWERANKSEYIENALKDLCKDVDDLTKKEKNGRIDIGYRTVAGKHIIVELKRPSRNVTLEDLWNQGRKYCKKLKKILAKNKDNDPDIEVIFILGTSCKIKDAENHDEYKRIMDSISIGSRIVYYQNLVESAKAAYAEYLDKAQEADRIWKIVDSI
jgi:hypothetical protein